MNSIFHLAFKVKDLDSTRKFYHEILGCELGREASDWIDINFFGNQLSAHISENIPELDLCGTVDGVKVPIPHFGCVLDKAEFDKVKAALEKHKIEFILKPQQRYKNEKAEQETMFVLDFSQNAIEFKCLKNSEALFA